jgi:hypothetical protein
LNSNLQLPTRSGPNLIASVSSAFVSLLQSSAETLDGLARKEDVRAKRTFLPIPQVEVVSIQEPLVDEAM